MGARREGRKLDRQNRDSVGRLEGARREGRKPV